MGGVWSCRGYCGMSFHNVIQSLNSHLINSLLPMTFLVLTSIVLFPRTFFISSSKAPSRITWSPGSRNTWYQFMVVQKQIGFLMILTAGLPKLYSTCFFAVTTCSNIGLQQLHHFRSCIVFLKVVVLNSGQVMIQRLL